MITEKAIAHIESLKQKIPLWIKDAILENAEVIIHLIQENQLSKGKDSSGAIVGTYSWTTEVYFSKDPQNKPAKPKIKGEPYNFQWSLELFESMNIRVRIPDAEYDIYSSTGKGAFLEKQFNTTLMVLTKENNDWVNLNIIEPYIAKKISDNLFNF